MRFLLSTMHSKSIHKIKHFSCVMGLVAMFLFGFPGIASASDLADAFNVLVSTTSPGVYQSQARGFMTGGGLNVHFPTKTVQLISVSPPSLNAGCSGISVFTGGLSYISADEFVDLLKGIASDALGYSFELALKTLCPVCSTVLSDLQAVSQAANRLAINQCQFSMGLINKAINSSEALNDYVFGQGANDKASSGSANDFLSSFDAFSGDVTQAINAISDSLNSISDAAVRTERYNSLPLGNSVWKSLNGMNDELRIFMQSLIGTTVRGPVGASVGSQTLVVSPIAPSLTMDELVKLFVNGAKALETKDLVLNECADSASLLSGEPSGSCSTVVKKPLFDSTWYQAHQSDAVGGIPIADVGFYGMSYALLFQALGNLESHEALGTPQTVTLPESVYGEAISVTATFSEAQIESFISLAPLPLYRAINLGAIYADVAEALVNNVSGVVAQHYAVAYLKHELFTLKDVGNVSSGTLGLSPAVFESIEKAFTLLSQGVSDQLKAVLSNLEATAAWTTQVNQVQSLVYQSVLQSGLSESFAFDVGLAGN